VIFRGKFRGISCGNDFSKLFPRKILIFPIIFWGKIFRGIFPGKNVRKIGPRSIMGKRTWVTRFGYFRDLAIVYFGHVLNNL
jgi:hypothetical protein